LLEANTLAALSLKEVWETFSHAAIKYEQEYKKIPVLIIDNANRLAEKQLEQIQDYAKRATDQGTATVVFVSSESHVPRHMIGKLFLFAVSFVCYSLC